LADGFGPKSAWPVRVCVAAPDSPQRTGSSAPLAGVRRYVTLSRLYVRRPAAARAVRRASAAVLHSFRRLHITLGNQEPFQSQALARAGRSERAVPLVRYFPNGVRSRLPVLLLRLPSRLTLTATGTNDEPVFSAPAGVGVPVDITS